MPRGPAFEDVGCACCLLPAGAICIIICLAITMIFGCTQIAQPCRFEVPLPIPTEREPSNLLATWRIVVSPFVVFPDNTTSPLRYEFGRGNYSMHGVMFVGIVKLAKKNPLIELSYKGECLKWHSHTTRATRVLSSGTRSEYHHYGIAAAEPFIEATIRVTP